MAGTDLATQATDLREWLKTKRDSLGGLPKGESLNDVADKADTTKGAAKE